MKIGTRVALLQWQANPADPAALWRLCVAWITPGIKEPRESVPDQHLVHQIERNLRFGLKITVPGAIIIAGVIVATAVALFPRYVEISHEGYHVEHDRWTGSDRICLDSYAAVTLRPELRCRYLP
jgi:hypothetical protein